MTPIYDTEHGNLSSLQVQQTLSGYDFGESLDLVTLHTLFVGLDIGYISDQGLSVSDSIGTVQVSDRTETTAGPAKTRTWTAGRRIHGCLNILYTALPRPVNASTRSGPALDFRLEQQGALTGSGLAFLAVPRDQPGKHVDATVSFDLSTAPEGVSAAWTFDDGGGNGWTWRLAGQDVFSKVQSTFFAVGPLRRYVPRGIARNEHEAASSTEVDFNMYWLGDPPFDASRLGSRLRSLFGEMRLFFGDRGRSYRVFLRHNPQMSSLTGTALLRSFMFGYDDSEYEFPPREEAREAVLAHEMVHNWARLDRAEIDDNWYAEGLAEYYSDLLLYRMGLLTATEYLAAVNSKLAAYYTNPLAHWDLKDVQKVVWEISHAQRVPYGRGFAFGMKLNGLIREATGGTASLDDVVVRLADLAQQRGQHLDVSDLTSLLSEHICRPAELIKDMRAGRIVIPREDSLESLPFRTRLARRDLEAFELGFDEAALLQGAHILTGLVGGSRAECAGLKNGDRVFMLFGSAYNVAKSNVGKTLKLRVEREGSRPFIVEYWPRSWDTVEAYEYTVITDDVNEL